MHRRLSPRPLLAAAAASLVLAGCGTFPGDAVVVGDSRMTMTKLDELAEAGCTFLAAQAASQGGSAPSQGTVRKVIATQELNLAGARAVAEDRGIEVPRSQWELGAADLAQLEKMFSGGDLDTMREVLERDYESQALRVAIGADETGTAVTQENAQQLSQAGSEVVANELRTLDASIDPRLGLDDTGADDPGLSLAASSEALEEVDPSTLPVNQQCGDR